VAVIKDAALSAQNHLPVRLLAEEICSQVPPKDYLSEALAVYNFTLAETRYMRDPRTVELVRAPHIIIAELVRGKTPSVDCDDSTALISSLILSTGGEVRVVTVAFRHAFFMGKRQYSHVFTEVREPRSNRWIVLDPVAAEKTDEMLRRVVAAKIWPLA
jgi:hypothetical protein